MIKKKEWFFGLMLKTDFQKRRRMVFGAFSNAKKKFFWGVNAQNNLFLFFALRLKSINSSTGNKECGIIHQQQFAYWEQRMRYSSTASFVVENTWKTYFKKKKNGLRSMLKKGIFFWVNAQNNLFFLLDAQNLSLGTKNVVSSTASFVVENMWKTDC